MTCKSSCSIDGRHLCSSPNHQSHKNRESTESLQPPEIKIAWHCPFTWLASWHRSRSANGGCGRHRPHRGLKVKSHTHCMETRELCKNSEGDPATPGLAATTCWQVFSVNELRGRLHSLGSSCLFYISHIYCGINDNICVRRASVNIIGLR